MLEDLFKVVKTIFNGKESDVISVSDSTIPENLMFKCPRCRNTMFEDDYTRNNRVCASCDYHGRLSAYERIRLTVDKDSFIEYDADMVSKNPIDFPGYEKKQSDLRDKTGLKDAVITGEACIRRIRAVIAVMDTSYMMASMGSVVGEKITRAIERATEKKLPFIAFTASGGARMQEGTVSLMQMAKTSGAIARHDDAGQLYITVLTDPTTGGVTASFASLGDIIIAEPKVLVGFAGRRVIEGTIKQRLPDDFQLAEFLMQKGFVDMIVERKKMRSVLSHLMMINNYQPEEI